MPLLFVTHVHGLNHFVVYQPTAANFGAQTVVLVARTGQTVL